MDYQARSFTDPELCMRTLEERAIDYIDEIRKIQPAGPYYLLGWSVGGLLAYAIACLLQRRGERVAFLSILDAMPFLGSEAENVLPHDSTEALSMLARAFNYDPIALSNVSLLYDRLRQDDLLAPCFTEHHFSALVRNLEERLGSRSRKNSPA